MDPSGDDRKQRRDAITCIMSEVAGERSEQASEVKE